MVGLSIMRRKKGHGHPQTAWECRRARGLGVFSNDADMSGVTKNWLVNKDWQGVIIRMSNVYLNKDGEDKVANTGH